MKLLIITQTVDLDDPNLGFFVAWIRTFASRCGGVEVIARKVGRHDLPGHVVVRSLGAERGVSKPGRWLNFWKHLSRALPECDAVFAHMCPEYVVAGAPWFLFGRKPVALWYTHKSVTQMLRLAARISDVILTASAESFRLASKKVRVVGHGIPFRAITVDRETSDRLRMLTVGRVAQVKGLHVIIEALAQIGDAFPWTYDVVGAPVLAEDAAYLERLRSRVAEAGLEARVRFLGPTAPDLMPAVYAAHDLFLHASETGGLDKVLLEAVGNGLPVVSSSEAAGFLPPEMHFAKGDSENLAADIRVWRDRLGEGKGVPQALIEQIRRAHGLDGLIERILVEINRAA